MDQKQNGMQGCKLGHFSPMRIESMGLKNCKFQNGKSMRFENFHVQVRFGPGLESVLKAAVRNRYQVYQWRLGTQTGKIQV